MSLYILVHYHKPFLNNTNLSRNTNPGVLKRTTLVIIELHMMGHLGRRYEELHTENNEDKSKIDMQ